MDAAQNNKIETGQSRKFGTAQDRDVIKNLKCSNWANTWCTNRIKDADYDSKIQIINYKNLVLLGTVTSSKILKCFN